MRLSFFILSVLFLLEATNGQATTKQEKTLIRKKRYLTFPENSNLIITLQSLKELLLDVPRGFRNVVEVDVFYPLPSKTFRYYKQKIPMHYNHKREIFDGLSNALESRGYNGVACVDRMICEIRYLAPFKDNALFKKLIFTIFTDYEEEKYDQICRNVTVFACDLSLLTHALHFIYGQK